MSNNTHFLQCSYVELPRGFLHDNRFITIFRSHLPWHGYTSKASSSYYSVLRISSSSSWYGIARACIHGIAVGIAIAGVANNCGPRLKPCRVNPHFRVTFSLGHYRSSVLCTPSVYVSSVAQATGLSDHRVQIADFAVTVQRPTTTSRWGSIFSFM